MKFIKNLLYFIYPIKGSMWEFNVDRLVRFLEIFDGKKVVTLATDDRTEREDVVLARLKLNGAEIIRVKNDPVFRETKAFMKMLERVESRKEDEATFYAHAKGVSRTGPCNENIKAWITAMLFMNLSCDSLVDAVLRTHDAMGCFKRTHPHAGSSWHYSGTFFWLKHSAIFGGDWRSIHNDSWGVEGYPGRHIKNERAYTATPSFDGLLYTHRVSEDNLKSWMRKAISDFKLA